MKKLLNEKRFFSNFFSVSMFFACSDNTFDSVVNPTKYVNAVTIKGGIYYDKLWVVEASYEQNNPNIEMFE